MVSVCCGGCLRTGCAGNLFVINTVRNCTVGKIEDMVLDRYFKIEKITENVIYYEKYFIKMY